jgi:hypothetical protein
MNNNRKYSGEVNFQFEIERIKNKETREYLTGEQFFLLLQLLRKEGCDYKKGYFQYSIIKLEIHGTAWYDPGINTGSYELSSPPEGEQNIISAVDNDKRDWKDDLTDDEIEEINELIIANCSDYD